VEPVNHQDSPSAEIGRRAGGHAAATGNTWTFGGGGATH
jgi:hypothetical protein